EFAQWLREQIKERPNATKSEVIKTIMDDKELSYIYFSKYLNYDKLIDNLFIEKPKVKPIPYWSIYKKQPKGYRSKPLYLSDCCSSGKSSHIACLETFSYWCNVWNMNN
ncbi:hypothetical protein U3516DRAFT_566143, partial [Neocallimastix sp. 'constans']